MLGGRGAGKTRLGAEWVRAQANGIAPYADQRAMHIALVGETEHDVREVMIEGPAGLLRVSPRFSVVLPAALQHADPGFLKKIFGQRRISGQEKQIAIEPVLVLVDQEIQQIRIALL